VSASHFEVLSRFLYKTLRRERAGPNAVLEDESERKRGGPGLTGIHRHFI
jgi:hypothetical protein